MATAQEQTTMRGWSHTTPGPPELVLKLSSDLPYPSKVGPTEVRVEISHAALNPGASIFTKLLPMVFRAKPSIPDMDFAGIIVSIGEAVPTSRNLKIGTRVFGNIPVPEYVGKGKGSMAEFVVVDSKQVMEIPSNMPPEQAAGLGIAGVTAVILIDAAKLVKGDRVLVNAASGGVGSLVVQMAKNVVGENGKVVAICSGGNAEMVKSLGADEVVDYTAHDSVSDYLSTLCSDRNEFDSMIDCLGNQDLYLNCARFLKTGQPYVTVGVNPGGTICWSALLWSVWKMMSNALWPSILGGGKRPWVQVTAMVNLKDMETLASMAAEGKLRVPIDSLWEMEDGLKAYERMLSKHARGKVIVKIN